MGTAAVYTVLPVLWLSLDFVKRSRANLASHTPSERYRGEATRGEEKRGEVRRDEARRGEERRGEARIEPDLGSVYFNPNDEFLLDSNFLGEIPGPPQQTPNYVELEGLPPFEDEACSKEVGIPSTEPMKTDSFHEDDACKQNDSQQVNREDILVNPPRLLSNMAFSEVTRGEVDVMDTNYSR
ncbi:hypothetical protein ACLB2K_077397 [Fragaria x ananassa]